MRGRYAKFIGTEFAKSDEQKQILFPIKHGDICASEFPDSSFDVIISGDVFEHVSDLDSALKESARILKSTGILIGTFPFLFLDDKSSRRASVIGDEVRHTLTPPIYHGDPMDPNGGCLVFELPGWDIIERARSAGFGDPVIELICDQAKGITASYSGFAIRPRGVFIAKFTSPG